MTAPTCATCRWWHGERDWHILEQRHTCKRFPPIAIEAYRVAWPETRHDDWCGEHAPKGEG